jgi:hypothetical protein
MWIRGSCFELETRLLRRIDRKRRDVFLRADFADLGGYDQVGRVSFAAALAATRRLADRAG